jgi:hypothetical protein
MKLLIMQFSPTMGVAVVISREIFNINIQIISF